MNSQRGTTRRGVLVLSAAALGTVLSGCGSSDPVGSTSTTTTTPDSSTAGESPSGSNPQPTGSTTQGPPSDRGPFDARAERVVSALREQGALAAYASSFVVLAPQVEWGGFTTDKAKEGALAGRGVITVPDRALPTPRLIPLRDGSELSVELRSARAAAEIALPQPCGPAERCALSLDSAQLTLLSRPTNRGEAKVPYWKFTGGGLAEPLLVLAATDPGLPWEPLELPRDEQVLSAEALHSVDGRTVHFGLGHGTCDVGVTPLVHETPDVIVLGGSVAPPTGQPCTAMLEIDRVSVTLKSEVGTRPIVSVGTGELLTPAPAGP